jgi:hypothetical protein
MITIKRLKFLSLGIALFIFIYISFFSMYRYDRFSPSKGQSSKPIYKDKSKVDVRPPILDNFSLLGEFDNGTLPSNPTWNKPPQLYVNEKTPLFIVFTRNWPMLQQCVLSYIAAGWPLEDIYVVDNTGTMKSNFPPQPQLTLQNPFYLNVKRL